jgi:hypothetical protein
VPIPLSACVAEIGHASSVIDEFHAGHRFIIIERKRSSGKVRQVRMLGLCLVAVLALVALTASSALAVVKNPTTSVKIFKNCPIHGVAKGPIETRPDQLCVFGATVSGAGGQFTVGGIKVPLAKQIELQYGLALAGEQEQKEYEETGGEGSDLLYVPPANGAEAITPTPEKVPGEPIANITEAEQQELGWPEGLKYSYKLAQKDHAVKTVYETIEGAGEPFTSIQNILTGEKPGVVVPVKIKGENKWLSELGDVCSIGSDEAPIVQHLTSGASESPLTHEIVEGSRARETAKLGSVEKHHVVRFLYVTDSDLVDNTYAVPSAACTGPYSSTVAATIDKEFHIPQPAGASLTEIEGTLYTGTLAAGEEAEA